MKSNFGLTEVEFHQMLSQLKQGDESLFLKIFVTHFKECRYYLVDKYGASKEMSYDICMDTLVEFRNKLLSNKIQFGNLRFLFTRMAVNNYIDAAKKSSKTNDAIQVYLENHMGVDIDNGQYIALLKKVLSSLNEKQQQFIEDLFYNQKDMVEIAEDNQISYANVRKMKERILTKLRTTFFDLIKELN